MFTAFRVAVVAMAMLGASLPSSAFASDLSLGVGAGWSTSPYKDYDNTFLPVPIINYNGDRFFVRGLSAGVHIWKNEVHEISAGLSYAPLSFDSDKTDDDRLERLDNRHSSINADLRYTLRTDYGNAGVVVSHDILGNGDGFSGELWYAYPFLAGPVRIIPSAGLHWDSADQLDYYFGVSDSESRISGLGEYSPDGGVSPFLSLAANWQFIENWSLTAQGRVHFLSSEIKDSPMVDKSQVFSTGVGVQYHF